MLLLLADCFGFDFGYTISSKLSYYSLYIRFLLLSFAFCSHLPPPALSHFFSSPYSSLANSSPNFSPFSPLHSFCSFRAYLYSSYRSGYLSKNLCTQLILAPNPRIFLPITLACLAISLSRIFSSFLSFSQVHWQSLRSPSVPKMGFIPCRRTSTNFHSSLSGTGCLLSALCGRAGGVELFSYSFFTAFFSICSQATFFYSGMLSNLISPRSILVSSRSYLSYFISTLVLLIG